MDVASISFKGANPSSLGSASGGAGTGKVRFDDLTVDKGADRGSAPLLTHLANGASLPVVVISIDVSGATGPVTVQRYTINPALVTGYSISTGASGTEHITMAVGAVKIEYFAASASGTSQAIGTFCWNVTTNSATCP
jgi:type VI secretion system secreted protein Hcp